MCLVIPCASATSSSAGESSPSSVTERVQQLEAENRRLRHELAILRLRELGAMAGDRGDGSVHVSFPHERYGRDSGGQRWYSFLKPLPLVHDIDCDVSIDAEATFVTDRDLALLKDARNVVSLGLNFTRLTDEALPVVGTLTSLRYLTLRNCRITDAGLEALANLKELRHLSLQTNREESSPRITDAGVAHLAGLTELRFLDLTMNPVGDDGVRHVAAMTKLRVLNLSGTGVGAAGLGHLSKLTELRELTLWHAKNINDAGLAALHGLPRLERVNLIHTKATRAGVDRLKAAVPGVEVRLSDGDPQFNWKRATDDDAADRIADELRRKKRN